MDFFFSATFVKYEIAFLCINLFYIAFHILHSLYYSYRKLLTFIGKKKTAERIIEEQEERFLQEEKLSKTTEDKEVLDKKETEKKSVLSGDEKQYLTELIKTIKTRIARGEFSEARARIIEGLSMDKFNKDLNCLLASLYEKDRDYKKAELIYKDLILMNDTDPELYLKLGFALSIQGKYEIAYEIYKRLLSLDEHNIETVDMLANLGHQLGHHSESNEYAYMFLKKNPHHSDILYLTAINHINLSERTLALVSLKKIRTIDPYNSKIQELIKKIELELELENNFKIEE
ncbi:hypothetical protein GW819_03640 [Candidatus Gracilibacteria bacterium]|nr:hypothetical protein [Candidatus Gracilibacteria bacterium]OIO76508.1 MAG: hypothetical protein AUJ87_02710 [Candidatus Gracilibacteria bacterium CG1_02_38_174]PIQ12384.1 MAG: hypothetical protein COW68_00025 [Candidatus Gracilibacteria bacterium CG18_big_fil_WC_8_21_14_2_50_38_16]PIQ41658.1 MAG: hypothetical protein COW06_02165 [Candidatus Gracilibacteria bacterium CG12_big_fil_rev_8_21_14_0_65_38_15]PIZ01317.1 MAG: hypothetical protein COY60_04140 [Candidatus Gracilibacteria bacterium CG_4